MRVRYAQGIRVGQLTVDPTGPVLAAFWTHRPPRRPPCGRTLASAPLARRWPGVLGLPFHSGAVAAGQRVELLPSGYGPGGAALLLTLAGRRTLVVGPTGQTLEPRRADNLVLFAPAPPAPPPAGWLAALADEARGAAPGSLRLSAPDSGAAAALVAALEAAELPWRGPRWLGGRPQAALQIALGGAGRRVDLRPQAPLAWLVEYATAVRPETVSVHGPQAHRLADALVAAGHSVAVVQGPRQLLLDDPPSTAPPPAPAPRWLTEGPGER